MTKKKSTTKRAATLKSPAHKQSSSSSWVEQNAKLYQLPFAQGDMNQASKQMQSMAENAMKAGADFMQSFMGAAPGGDASKMFSSFDPAKMMAEFNPSKMFSGFDLKPHDKVMAYGQESAEQLQKTAGAATRAVNEAVELSRENAEAAMECGNIAVAVSKSVSAELINYMNQTFAQNVELSKQIFNCRTLNDMFDLSSRFMKSNLDSFFNESVKVSELAFSGAGEIAEPLNERISESAERLVKAVAA